MVHICPSIPLFGFFLWSDMDMSSWISHHAQVQKTGLNKVSRALVMLHESRAPPHSQHSAGSKAPDSAPSAHSALDLCFAEMPGLFSSAILQVIQGMGSSLPLYNLLLLLVCLFFKVLIFLHLWIFHRCFFLPK